MKYRIKHTTHYEYSSQVSMCFNEARMSPVNSAHQTCARNRFVIHPAPESLHKRFDYFGNQVTSFDILQPHRELSVTVYSEVQVLAHAQQALFSADYPWEFVRDSLKTTTDPEQIVVREYILPSMLIPVFDEVKEYADKSFKPGRPVMEAIRELVERIFKDFKYDPGFSSISTPLKTVLEHRRGVCQDFAHLGIACIRSMGLAAGYVSGYLETLPPPGQEKLEGADASHAWLAVYLPDHGWMHLDPTNNMVAGDQHITLAFGRDFADVTPLKGVIYGGDDHELSVSVDVRRIEE
ncbi:transglutaminase family protein [Ketobacter alkanivorans]|uniref:Transglutaminase n=1 Tax=Ketobacter alkanivorans TaxID=1917421 RepID=A0A2K9LKZ1_9GAMM|nr:transglutaminase family protein [Ketobacter alkanivorans]AUM12851.1 transglutaminase [Ketobacter alkanivorans]MCP5014527.1 transglutaminase family protein [Ketobacter sp.]